MSAPVISVSELNWGAGGLLPAVVQDVRTGQVLMVAYMNAEALQRTLATGQTWFWSRSRGKYWQKGETSGHVQHVRAVRTDCDRDTLLVLVEQVGVACHEGTYSCFNYPLAGAPALAADQLPAHAPNAPPAAVAAIGPVLAEVAAVLRERLEHPDPASYTARQFAKGPDAVLKKVAEEAGEVLLAAKGGDRAGLVWEVADLWFHSLMVLAQNGITLDEIAVELARRRGQRRPDPPGPQ